MFISVCCTTVIAVSTDNALAVFLIYVQNEGKARTSGLHSLCGDRALVVSVLHATYTSESFVDYLHLKYSRNSMNWAEKSICVIHRCTLPSVANFLRTSIYYFKMFWRTSIIYFHVKSNSGKLQSMGLFIIKLKLV